jgi:predicted RNase H-like nuclease (RuvC/YqgF family)
MINSVVDKIKQVGYGRCGSCPAFWSSTDYWGESDAGCQLNRDIYEFCKLSFAPKAVIKSLIKKEEKRMDKHWTELGEQIGREQRETEALRNALIKTFEAYQIELSCFGNKVDLTDSHQLTNDLHHAYKLGLQEGER